MQTDLLSIKSKDYIYVNNLKDFSNIRYFVWTFSKTGTSSLATALQILHDGTNENKNVVHCHDEGCWKNYFHLNDNFKIMDIVECQKEKPIIFQLYRNPIERLISEYFYLKKFGVDVPHDINNFLINKLDPCFEYYEEMLNFKFSNIKYNKSEKFCFIEKDRYYLYFTALEHFHKLKKNLQNIFNKRGFNFDSFEMKCYNLGSYDKSSIQINDNIIETLFENNKSIIDFYYTNDEITKFKNQYKKK